MQRKQLSFALVLLVAAAFCTLSTPVFADWSPNVLADQQKAKWVQLPNITTGGMDVLDTIQPISPIPSQWKTLADDFLCTQSGPITDAHVWGSWLGDQLPINSAGLPDPNAIQFHIQFWDDVPAGTGGIAYSRPGNLLWTGSFGPGQFTVNPNVISANEQFYDPNIGQTIGTDTQVYQYNFPDLRSAIGNYFVQTAGNIYWFEVQANVLNLPGGNATYGWKTADPNLPPRTYFPNQTYSFMDDAVFADTAGFADPNVNLLWRDMIYPANNPFAGKSIDLSFVLTSVPEPSSVAMAGLGLLALVGTAYRRASISRR